MFSRAINASSSSTLLSLNSDDCLSLSHIVASFNAPITEEHAFAVIYQGANALRKLWHQANVDDGEAEQRPLRRWRLVDSPADIMLHKDGRVHESTFSNKSKGERERELHGWRRKKSCELAFWLHPGAKFWPRLTAFIAKIGFFFSFL